MIDRTSRGKVFLDLVRKQVLADATVVIAGSAAADSHIATATSARRVGHFPTD